MKQVTQHNKTGTVRVEQVPPPALKPGHVLVQTSYSLISAGTERASISNRKASMLEKARSNPDLVAKVLEQVKQYGLVTTYRRVRDRLDSWASLGYSASGVVLATGEGVSHVKAGARVACAGGGFANHAEFIVVPKNLCVAVPRGADLADAAYTTLGAIALQGVRQAEPMLGEIVAVIGLGLVGQLTVQLLKANGCAVIGIDLDQHAVNLAEESGADVAIRRGKDVKKIIDAFTQGHGVDAVIITAATKSDDPVRLAGELCREKGRVVLVGDVGLHLPRPPYYMKELDFRLSRSYGPGRYDVNYEERGVDYPFGYVRWTEQRNMAEFLRLLAGGQVDVKKLTTHRFKVDDAKAAYAMISGSRSGPSQRYVGILLEYESSRKDPGAETKVEYRQGQATTSGLQLGFLGAGSFAQGSLLPPIQSFRGTELVGVCTSNGLSAANVAQRFRFGFATTNPDEVIGNGKIGTIFIAARHNVHARYTIDGIKAGKNVFVEKPLAMNAGELQQIVKAYREEKKHPPMVMVGFNRRFAPLVRKAKHFFESSVAPFAMNYRVSAGLIPSSHWSQDPLEGGGRIIGEVCHFVDLLSFFANATPIRVFAEPLGASDRKPGDDDSVLITLKFDNGSVGVITYLANGDSAVPKEYLEVFSTGRTAVIDNFRTLAMYEQGKKSEVRSATVDKGHQHEIESFLRAVTEGKPSPIPFTSLVSTTMATFRIMESLKLGVPLSV
ncbi:MAG: bi-domain-containing oxidoreductase [Bacteroidota bacterium]